MIVQGYHSVMNYFLFGITDGGAKEYDGSGNVTIFSTFTSSKMNQMT